ncbi:kinase-like protein [Rozella allomycis CSF55]|uniref:Kinase-like protein n=1 Tax=Rozella allomycis (strain CSF55) TaxID=988480 RepID=A0A4P9YAW1_ROZAC|nr:kinase-like protein [Rozella allomycis CSF55]
MTKYGASGKWYWWERSAAILTILNLYCVQRAFTFFQFSIFNLTSAGIKISSNFFFLFIDQTENLGLLLSIKQMFKRKIVGDYQLGRTIGEGAFSKVKLGYHIVTNEKVAVKVLVKADMEASENKSVKSQKIDSKSVKSDFSKSVHSEDKVVSRKKEPVIPEENTLEDVKDMAGKEAEPQAEPNTLKTKERDIKKSNENISNTEEINSISKKADDSKYSITNPNYVPEYLRHLSGEVKLLMRLNHPNIVKLYQLIDTPTELFVIMY